ncbi:hypothetical protein O6H91_05G117600 [Diphasiastrum complanatum]|uniref:Uncharacterized protein n=1 Tax=Diphasiastrum complanatum TaxID=34168 RepID=A0ACC2DSL0_DIPCM|nr:hypothetical protein O6H91_05G117600 [Diphasiastrum complanatum]
MSGQAAALSDNNITAWIDYDANLQLLDIYVSHNAVKPQKSPLLSYRIDLATIISEYMYHRATNSWSPAENRQWKSKFEKEQQSVKALVSKTTIAYQKG